MERMKAVSEKVLAPKRLNSKEQASGRVLYPGDQPKVVPDSRSQNEKGKINGSILKREER